MKNIEFKRRIPHEEVGLLEEEIQIRQKLKLNNNIKSKTSKSYTKIIFGNIFTFFNMVLIGIGIFFLICNMGVFPQIPKDSFKITKFGFLIPLTINILIGTIQEIKSKIILEKLHLINKSTYTVIRNSKKDKITTDNILLDDIIEIEAGSQIPADLKILSGNLEVDESMLTGESDHIKKSKDDELLSGSFVISGKAICYVDKIGHDTYAMRLQSKVKNINKNKSELMKNIYGIIKVMSVLLVLIVMLMIGVLIYKKNTHNALAWKQIVESLGTVAVGLIPSGLVLITSITLAVSIIQLSKKKVLISELYSLENLSRVDVICFDKTGTLTDGTMTVKDVIKLKKDFDLDGYMSTLLGSLDTKNQTSIALLKKFTGNIIYDVYLKYEFNSNTKCSSIILNDGSEFKMGAPEFLIDNDNTDVLDIVNKKADLGLRVLALLYNNEVVGLVTLADTIRKSATDAIKYFNNNFVDIKIISGDNPITVSRIAKMCGVKNSEKIINMQNVKLEDIPNIVDEFTIFGRITPEQKEAVVKALQEKGHKVAMTGDGINDILAMKSANCSITFNSASDAAKGISDVVLMDNGFDNIHLVVAQGRRVVNNIQRTAILFLMKTFFIVFISLFTIPTAEGISIISMENLYVLEFAIIAGAGFLLSVENTSRPITGTFKSNVYSKALASGLLLAVAAMTSVALYKNGLYGDPSTEVAAAIEQAMLTILTSIAGVTVLIMLCQPVNPYRSFVLTAAVFIALMLVIAYPNIVLTPSFDIYDTINVLLHPFDFQNSVYIYMEKECYIAIIFFMITIVPVYVIIIKFIDFVLKRTFMKHFDLIALSERVDEFLLEKIKLNKHKDGK